MFDRQLVAHKSTVFTVVGVPTKNVAATLACATTCLQVVPVVTVGLTITCEEVHAGFVVVVDVVVLEVVVLTRVVLDGFDVVEGVVAATLPAALLAEVVEAFVDVLLDEVAEDLSEVLVVELEESLTGVLAALLVVVVEATLFALLLLVPLEDEVVVLLRAEVDVLLVLVELLVELLLL